MIKEKYFKLTVIKEVSPFVLPSGQKNKAILCKCDCGKEKVIRKLHLVRGRVKSCGCLNKTKKGLSTHPLYKILQAIKLRTQGHYNDIYKKKDIKLCDEWQDFMNFYNWAINNGYKKNLQIDRINGNKGYNPENCRFVTPKENVRNRENTIIVNYNGKKEVLCKILEEKNKMKNYSTIIGRIKRGWSIEKAIDFPIKKGNYKKKLKII